MDCHERFLSVFNVKSGQFYPFFLLCQEFDEIDFKMANDEKIIKETQKNFI